jgi:hypothetical protein
MDSLGILVATMSGVIHYEKPVSLVSLLIPFAIFGVVAADFHNKISAIPNTIMAKVIIIFVRCSFYAFEGQDSILFETTAYGRATLTGSASPAR